MLKMFTYRKIAITTLLFFLALILYNYPENINYASVSGSDCKKIDVYLIDKNNLVGLTKVNSTSTNSQDKIEDIISYLTIGSGLELPEGFNAIIPKNTKLLNYSLNDGLLKLDFSKELLNVTLDNEEELIESLIYSLTTLDEVDRIMIFVEGDVLLKLPNSHQRLDLYLNRDYGINKVVDLTTFSDVKSVTVYYLNKIDEYYYVPVTYITDNSDSKIDIIVNSLKSNKFNNSNLLSHLNYQVELMNYEADEEEFLLNFNDVLLESVYDGELKEEIKYALAYSIFDTYDVKNVVFQVNSAKIDEFRLEK